MTDVSRLSNADLEAISRGDMTAVSDYGLQVLSGDTAPSAPTFTPEQIAAHAKRAAVSSVRGESPILAKAADYLAGATSVMRGVLPESWMPTRAVDKESGTYLAGQITDPAAMLVGAGGVKAAQMATLAPKVGAKIASSPIVRGMLGGALGGAGVGALSEDQSAASGGMMGAVFGGAIPAVGKATGAAWDRLSGTAPGLRAKNIISKAYGDKIDQARALWKGAPSDLSATQVAAPTGSTTGAALGARAAEQQSQYFDDLARAQAGARRSAVSGVAGGDSQTAALSAQKQSKQALNELTTPLREAELGAANIAGDVTRNLEPRIAQKQASMIQALQDSGRAFADENTARQALLQKLNSKTPGWVKPETIAELEANVLKQRGAVGDVNAMKWQRQDERDFLARQLSSLSDYGLKPIDTGSILGRIESKLTDPKLAGNSIASRAMEDVANEIATWTARNGGTIDAQALYAIRKNAVNATIQRQLAGATPKAQQKVAAGVLEAINPLIDDAITSAGGTGWKNYLTEYATGAKLIDRQKLGARALELLESNPKGFVKLVDGNDPKTVRKIFTTESDVVKAMASDYQPLSRVSKEISRDAALAERAAAGRTDLGNILSDNASKTWVPKLISWKLALAREAGDVIEAHLNKTTMNRVYAAMRSGKDAEEVMALVPARERKEFLNLLYSGKAIPASMGATQAGAEQ